MQLYYSPGSPYARVARVLVLEAGLACEAVEETQFPPSEAAKVNPALQVPALVDGARRLFGTRLIAEYLMGLPRPAPAAGTPPLAAAPTRAETHWRDAQILVGLESLLSALVLRAYLVWSGVEHRPDARIPMNMAAREQERAQSLLDWLESEATADGFLPGCLSLQDLWLIATVEWAEARLPVDWRGRPALAGLVARHAERPSLVATRPQPWG